MMMVAVLMIVLVDMMSAVAASDRTVQVMTMIVSVPVEGKCPCGLGAE